MRSGGTGGFEHINNHPEKRKQVSRISSETGKGIVRHVPTAEEREASKQRNLRMKELGIGPFSQDAIAKANLNRIAPNLTGSKNGSYGTKFYYNLATKEKKRFKANDVIPEGWVGSVDYFESKKKTYWYNNGFKSFLLKVGDPKTEQSGLVKGRL